MIDIFCVDYIELNCFHGNVFCCYGNENGLETFFEFPEIQFIDSNLKDSSELEKIAFIEALSLSLGGAKIVKQIEVK